MANFISERFKKGLVSHIVLNSVADEFFRPSLIYGIHGAPGDGKTFQCEKILSEYDIKQFLISGGELENYQAGEPSELIRRTYINASSAVKSGNCECAVIVINDIDASIGDWGSLVQYTVNRQSVFSELMHLCDFPNVVSGVKTERIPIVITGNNLNRLYSPLTRTGRMRMFEWIPTLEESIEIVSGIYNGFYYEEIRKIILDLNSYASSIGFSNRGRNLPISFYSELKRSIVEDSAWGVVEPLSVAGINAMSNSLRSSGILYGFNYQTEFIIAHGIRLINSISLKNHLE